MYIPPNNGLLDIRQAVANRNQHAQHTVRLFLTNIGSSGTTDQGKRARRNAINMIKKITTAAAK